jgi:ankyrin repeat protein
LIKPVSLTRALSAALLRAAPALSAARLRAAPALSAVLLLAAPALFAAEADLRLPAAAMNGDIDTMRALVAEGADPDTRGSFDTPALHWVVRVDDVESARLLLEAGADANAATSLGVSPLSLAVESGNTAMIALLLEHGANANATLPSGESLLMSAAAVGVTDAVSALLDHGADIAFRDAEYDQSALMIAAREGHASIVALLLEHGADVNAATKIGPAPKFIAPNSVPGFGFGVGILRGGVPKDRGRREPQPGGLTPLHYAARHNHIDIAELLLDAGAELNAKEANGIWPLLMAISNNNMPMAHFLLERGKEQDDVLLNDQDWYGRSPIWEAVNVRNLYVHNGTYVNGIDRAPVLTLIEALIDAGADLNVRTKETPPVRHHLLEITGTLEWVDFTGQTPFLAAAYAGDVTVMKLLLEHGADPNIHTFEGTSPLMAAAGVNWVYAQTYTESPEQLLEAVKMCFELGMDVNQQNSMGLTALMGAANRGSDAIIRFLVGKGADLTKLDNENRSALDWAKGVFLATHPAEPKPSSIALITELLTALPANEQGKEVR